MNNIRVHWMSSRDFQFDRSGKHHISVDAEFPIKAAYVRFRSDHILTPSYHDYLELVLVKKGRAMVNVESREVTAQEGDLILIGTEVFHVISPYDDQPTEFLCLFFHPELIYGFGSQSIDFEFIRPFYEQQNNFLVPKNHMEPVVPELMQSIVDSMEEKEAYYRQKVKSQILIILTHVLNHYGNYDVNQGVKFNKKFADLHRLKTVFDYMAQNISKTIVLEDLAKTAYMSKAYFCRFFKESTGFTATEYLSRMRIDQAKIMVLKSNFSISQIAAEVGFQNTSSFNKAFRRLTHMSPSEFRRSHSV